MKNQLTFLFSLLIIILVSGSCNQEKCMKEYIECRDNCYNQADQVREQWSQAMDDCQDTFDAALQACFELEDDNEFLECYKRANAAFQNCRNEANQAYDEGMAEVASCVETCKTKFEECSKK